MVLRLRGCPDHNRRFTCGWWHDPSQPWPLDATQLLSIRRLSFIAEDVNRLGRFLALSGIGPAEIRARAGYPAFLGGVLDSLLSDDERVVDFA